MEGVLMLLSLFLLTKEDAIVLPWNTEPHGTQRSPQEKTKAGSEHLEKGHLLRPPAGKQIYSLT